MDGQNSRKGVTAALALVLVVVCAVAIVRRNSTDSFALAVFQANDVQSQIENDAASRLLIQKDVRLAIKISGDAEKIYITADSAKKKYENEVQAEQKQIDEAHAELGRANALRSESQSLVHQSQKELDELHKRESWAEEEQQRAEAAAQRYRHDVMHMADEVSRIAALKQEGKQVPAKLKAELKNITEQLKTDSAKSKKDFYDLSHKAEVKSISSPGDAVTLQVPATAWSLDQKAQQEKSKAVKQNDEAKARIAALKEKEDQLKESFKDSECLEKMAEQYRFDDHRVHDADHAYAQVLADCRKSAAGKA